MVQLFPPEQLQFKKKRNTAGLRTTVHKFTDRQKTQQTFFIQATMMVIDTSVSFHFEPGFVFHNIKYKKDILTPLAVDIKM